MRKILALVVGLSLWASVAVAGPSNYVPLPDYNTGNAIPGFSPGRSQTEDTNRHLNGTSAIEPKLTHYVFADLPSEVDYKLAWCDDCAATNPCTGGGAGPAVLAYGFSGAWVCSLGGGGGGGGSDFPLGADVSGASLWTITHLRSAVSANEPVTYAQSGAQLTVNQNTTSLISTGSVSTAGGSPLVVAAPATIVNGRALVGAILADGTPTITPPSGFTLIRNVTSGAIKFATYCKTASSESGSYTFTFTGGGTGARAYITQLDGTDCSHIDGSTGVAAAYPSLPTVTGVATLHTNDLIIAAGTFYCGDTPNVNIGKVFYHDGNVGALVGSWRTQPTIGTSSTAIVGQVPANCGGGVAVIGQQIAFAPITTNQGGVIVSDQDARLTSLTASVGNVLNVMAPPYNALGDGNSDDLNGIQQAIFDACGATPPTAFPSSGAKKSVYLPAPAVCYMHSQPIRLPCPALEFKGDIGTKLCQNYIGEAVIQEGWGYNNLPYSTALMGSGQSLVSAPGALSESIDLSRTINGTGSNNFASKVTANGFNIALYMKRTAAGGLVMAGRESYPGSVGHDWLACGLTGSGGTAVSCSLYTAALASVSLAACGAQTNATVYEIEIDWDKTNYRLWQGVPGGTAVICDTQASSSPPIGGPFYEFMLPPGGHHAFWPDGSSNVDNAMTGFLGPLHIQTRSKHTVAYTVPNTSITPGDDTYYFTDFRASLDGTQIGFTGASGTVYSVVLGATPGAVPAGGNYIHDMDLCSIANGGPGSPDGLFSVWGNNSRYINLSCSSAFYSQLDLFNNDYLSRVENWQGFGGHVGLNIGAAFNDGVLFDNQVDGTDVACEVNQGGGGGDYEDFHTHCIDRGGLYYGWIQNASQAHYTYPFVDQETTNANWKATFLLNNPPGPNVFNSGNIDTRSGAPYILNDFGGYGSLFNSMIFNSFGEDQPAVDVVKYTNGSPLTATILMNSVFPADVPASNLPDFIKHGPGCSGPVTLSSGAGLFNNQCMFASDNCSGQDRTTPANMLTTTVGNPSMGRFVNDGVTNTTTTITSATMAFNSSADVGRLIYGTGIPVGATIASVSSGTTAIISAAATASASSLHFTLGPLLKISGGTGTDVIAVSCQ